MNNWLDKLGSFGFATAIITPKVKLSYKDLYIGAQQIVNSLKIKSFSNIGILCYSRLNTLLSLFAIWEVRANAIILDHKLDKDKLSSLLSEFEIGFIVSDIEINLSEVKFSKRLRENLNKPPAKVLAKK